MAGDLERCADVVEPLLVELVEHRDQEIRERRDQLRHPAWVKPELVATGPNQLWSWDITRLRSLAAGTFYYLYVILDVYSRYVVGWMLAHRESADLARRLIRETVVKQSVVEEQLTIHSDRGPSMTSHGVAQLLASLGVTKSHSRPQVSNDNPFSESQFKTMKYRPEFPERFSGLEEARAFIIAAVEVGNLRNAGLRCRIPERVEDLPDLGQREAAITAWYGDDMETTTLFTLTLG